MTGGWNWRAAARCRTTDAEGLFVTGARQREAKLFCRACPVRTECLAHALDQRIEFGVWGGMTERERRALLRTRPDVRSWADLLYRRPHRALRVGGGGDGRTARPGGRARGAPTSAGRVRLIGEVAPAGCSPHRLVPCTPVLVTRPVDGGAPGNGVRPPKRGAWTAGVTHPVSIHAPRLRSRYRSTAVDGGVGWHRVRDGRDQAWAGAPRKLDQQFAAFPCQMSVLSNLAPAVQRGGTDAGGFSLSTAAITGGWSLRKIDWRLLPVINQVGAERRRDQGRMVVQKDRLPTIWP